MTTFEELLRETTCTLEPLAMNYLFKIRDKKFPVIEQQSMPSTSDAYAKFVASYLTKENSEDDTLERDELVELKKCGEEVKTAHTRLETCRGALETLKDRYEVVAENTSSLHDACDQLMADQTRLAAAAEDIRAKLYYFDHVQPLMQKLNSTHMAVGGQAFTHALSTIDECLAFLHKQRDYLDAQAYITKYEQCLSRALTAVKSYVQSTLAASAQAVKQKSSDDDDHFAALYGVFATHANAVRVVMETVESKFDRAQEYQSVLGDCYQAYFVQRDALLRPSITATVQQLTKKHANSTCTLTRTGCGFLLRLCEDEYRLFFQFFTRPTELLHDFTERLCRIFYDVLRPLVIHSPHLETLAELCSILKVEMLEERCAIEGDTYDGFVHVMGELVGDVGERLVYRAHMYAQSDIQNYQPASGDLAYPEKLRMMQSINMEQRNKDGQQDPNAGPVSAVDLHGLWYPTVRRTVLTLSKLFKCLDPAVFQGVSQETLSMCVESLLSATEKIAVSKKPLDAQLFLVKHLLILREQTSPYRAANSLNIRDTSVDFSKVKDAAAHLMNQKDRWFVLSSNNAFLEFLFLTPMHVSESVTDGRRVLDVQLKNSCQKLISMAADNVILELVDFLIKAEVMVSSGGKDALKTHPFLAPDSVQKLTSQAYRKLKDHVPALKQSFSLYIANPDTENILITPVKKRISDAFTKMAELVRNNYTEEDQQIIACPNAEQLSLLLNQ